MRDTLRLDLRARLAAKLGAFEQFERVGRGAERLLGP